MGHDQPGATTPAQPACSPADAPLEVLAIEFTGRHVGMLVSLPGHLDGHGRWPDTTAPITQVIHCKSHRVMIRRHPDQHVDHALAPDTVLTLHPAPAEPEVSR